MKNKKAITIITLLCFFITLLPAPVFAATSGAKVTATIPTFKVTMNGQVVDNTYREYPFLVYNDVTYFPMTYWDMRFLGVSNTWSAETGSIIVADGSTSEYKPTLSTNKNKVKNTATVNSGAFKVNGKTVDNAKEKYPILSFRNVPYFPLTWDWCQEFGWNINFNATNGLTVNTIQQNTIKNPTGDSLNKKVESFLQGCWAGLNERDDKLFVECYKFEDNNYSCVCNVYTLNKQTGKANDLILFIMEEGTFSCSDDGNLILTRTAHHMRLNNSKEIITEKTSKIYNYILNAFETDEGTKIRMNDWEYAWLVDEDANKVYEKLKDDSFNNTAVDKPKSIKSSDYAYLAGNDFRSVQRDYPHAVAQCAYVYAYNNIEGELCVLTYNRYKIKTNWDEITLHNLTTGDVISNPSKYYENLADRSAGNTKIHYMDLQSEVDGNLIRMMKAMSDVLKTGNNTWNGVFVDANTLNK